MGKAYTMWCTLTGGKTNGKVALIDIPSRRSQPYKSSASYGRQGLPIHALAVKRGAEIKHEPVVALPSIEQSTDRRAKGGVVEST